MISEEVYIRLKEEVENLERERSEAIGAKQQILTVLKKEFKCKTLAQAKTLLKKLKKEKKENESKFWESYREFKRDLASFHKKMEKRNNRMALPVSNSTVKPGRRKKRNK